MSTINTRPELLNELPPLPEIYIRVSELVESNTSTSFHIGEAVQTDITLTTRILKMVNSAYYGFPNPITSISQAITMLGRQHLRQVLMGSVLVGVFKDIKAPGFSLEDFWLHSITTAIIARHLAMQNARIIDHEAFFTAGLLHDIGRLVIAKVEPDSLAEINDLAEAEATDPIQIEMDILGTTHVEVGSALMKKWNMPSLLSQCVEKHHNVDHSGPFAMETCIVYLANLLSKQFLVIDDVEMQIILSAIPNWEQTFCTFEQINIACRLADDQRVEVLESLGMIDPKMTHMLYKTDP